MIYRLRTPAASFELRREPQGMWDLWVDGTPTLTFATPEEGAAAVAARETGAAGWDNASAPAPADLSGWERADG